MAPPRTETTLATQVPKDFALSAVEQLISAALSSKLGSEAPARTPLAPTTAQQQYM
jgi:hypothetical protein